MESLAFDAKIAQQFTNVFRRLFGLPILRYGWQAEEEVKRKYLAPSLGEAVAADSVISRRDVPASIQKSDAINCIAVGD